MKYLTSDDLTRRGQEILAKHHPNLKPLEIAFMFRDEAPKSGDGHTLFGMAISVDSRNWLLHRKDVIIMICQDTFEAMTPDFQTILLDHELCHVGIQLDDKGCMVLDEASGRPKVRMIRHDLEEFYEVMDRYKTNDLYNAFRKWTQELVQSRMTDRKKKTVKALAGNAV